MCGGSLLSAMQRACTSAVLEGVQPSQQVHQRQLDHDFLRQRRVQILRRAAAVLDGSGDVVDSHLHVRLVYHAPPPSH